MFSFHIQVFVFRSSGSVVSIQGWVFRCGIQVWEFTFRGIHTYHVQFSHSMVSIYGWVFRCGYSGLGISVWVWVFMFRYFIWHDYMITAVRFSFQPPHPCTGVHFPTLDNYPCTTSEQIPTAQ